MVGVSLIQKDRHEMILCSVMTLVILVIFAFGLTGCDKNINRGMIFTLVENTLAQPGPVRDDLIKRGLATTPTTDANGSPKPGEIKIGEIENLVKDGVYSIEKDGYLGFGPNHEG